VLSSMLPEQEFFEELRDILAQEAAANLRESDDSADNEAGEDEMSGKAEEITDTKHVPQREPKFQQAQSDHTPHAEEYNEIRKSNIAAKDNLDVDMCLTQARTPPQREH